MARMALATVLAAAMAAAAAETGEVAGNESGPADIAAQAKEFERRIAELHAVDPLQPQTLSARLDYARLLEESSAGECLPGLDAAERQLAPMLSADPNALIAWPDGVGDALSLLQTIHNARAQCADDEAAARAAFESAIATGERAIAVLRDNWDFEEMAIVQFNIAFARRELGDLDGAVRDLEQVLDWDQEFGFHEELESDYATLLRWRAGGEEPDPAEVERFVRSFNPTKARFEFSWKPHQARWSTEVDRANLKNGAFGEVSTRYQSHVEVRRDQDDWVVSTTMEGKPTVAAAGAAAVATEAERIQDVVASLTAAPPELVVGSDGTFKELRNLEGHRREILDKLRRMVAESAPAAERTKAEETLGPVLDAAFSPQLLTTMAAGQWDIAVGAWIGAEFDHGDWYSLTFEEALPGFSDQPVSKTMTFKVSRWLPCTSGGRPECVEVLVRIVPEAAAMARAVTDFVTRVMPSASKSELEKALRAISYEFDVRYRLVTEPDTLRPWSIEERKYVYASSIEGGKRMAVARRDRTLESAQYIN